MTPDLIRYLVEQASGIVIAFVLIVRVEKRLDSLTEAINRVVEHRKA